MCWVCDCEDLLCIRQRVLDMWVCVCVLKADVSQQILTVTCDFDCEDLLCKKGGVNVSWCTCVILKERLCSRCVTIGVLVIYTRS